MTTNTILLIVLSLGIAFALSFYQYYYKAKNRSKVTLFLAFLRFFSIFGLLLLLINPIITRKTIETVKTPLPIVIDNSASMADLKLDKEANCSTS
jgi:cytochrome bd-type quinol oxidase subunit 2